MHKHIISIVIVLLFAGCSTPEMFFNPPGGGEGNVHHLDGINDFTDTQIVGIDPVGDISEKSLDLDTLWAVIEDSMLYIGFNAYASHFGLSYGVYIFPDSILSSGATGDPWNRAVNYDGFYPEYILYFWHDETENNITSANFWTFSGSWSYKDITSNEFILNKTNHFMEIGINLSELGDPDSVYIEVFTTGSENSHAQDTSPSDSNVSFPNPDWSSTVTSLSNAVLVK